MSDEEKWVTEVKEQVDNLVENTLYDLRTFAEDNDLDYSWVLETYRDKITYKVNKTIK